MARAGNRTRIARFVDHGCAIGQQQAHTIISVIERSTGQIDDEIRATCEGRIDQNLVWRTSTGNVVDKQAAQIQRLGASVIKLDPLITGIVANRVR